MKRISLMVVVGLAALAGACTTDQGYNPYYGPSQGYAYPPGYYNRPYYPGPYAQGPAYYGQGYNSGPSITLTLPAGNIP
jgi:hypothetical protein